jgi:hypothetical protein
MLHNVFTLGLLQDWTPPIKALSALTPYHSERINPFGKDVSDPPEPLLPNLRKPQVLRAKGRSLSITSVDKPPLCEDFVRIVLVGHIQASCAIVGPVETFVSPGAN